MFVTPQQTVFQESFGVAIQSRKVIRVRVPGKLSTALPLVKRETWHPICASTVFWLGQPGCRACERVGASSTTSAKLSKTKNNGLMTPRIRFEKLMSKPHGLVLETPFANRFGHVRNVKYIKRGAPLGCAWV